MTTAHPLFVFSLLHAESLECLDLCIRNFKLFAAPGDKLLISSSNPQVEVTHVEDPDVFIFKSGPRSAHGADLLQSHIENWRFAQKTFYKGHENYLFITIASNALFYRAYDKGAVLQSMTVAQAKEMGDMNDGWQYETIRKCDSFMAAFGSRFVHCQIEGFATFGVAWGLIEEKFEELDYKKHALEKPICLEEVLPLVALAEFKQPSTHICQMKWDDSRQGRRFVTVKDLFVEGRQLPPHKCMYKWFDRRPETLASRLVTDARLNHCFTTLYDEMADWGRKPTVSVEMARSFLDSLAIPKSVIEHGSFYFEQAIDATLNRKLIRIKDGLSQSPFIYFEFLPDGFVAQLSIQIEGGKIDIRSTSSALTVKPNADAYMDLRFYAVLYIPIPEYVEQLFLTDFAHIDHGQMRYARKFDNREMMLNFGVLEHRGGYEVIYADANSFGSDWLQPFAYYDVSKTQNKGVRCFGLPIIPNTDFSYGMRGR